MQDAVLLGLGGYKSLKGIITIGLHSNGISFRVMPPFALFHPPLFIPYDDIRGWRTTWYLDAHSIELEFLDAPAVKMIVPAAQAEWMQTHSGRRMVLHDTEPPAGKAGRGWYAFVLVSASFSLLMLASIVVIALVQAVT